jgi:hydroxyethylthiazole kinase-like uncharacterized protein yjeF
MSLPIRALERSLDTHKGSHGSLGVVGGATGTVGAVFLCARSALYTGTGRVFVFRPHLEDGCVLDYLAPELMVLPIDQCDTKPIDTWVVGPGLGQSSAARSAVQAALQRSQPLVLDADALNLLAIHHDLAQLCRSRESPTILTPHPGEAARLLGTNTKAIQNDRNTSAQALVEKFHAIVVLKGYQSIIAGPSQPAQTNHTGNPSLATAGTGDVLAGFIGSLLAQGLTAFEAATLAVHIHGEAADTLSRDIGGMIGVTASELISEMRRLVNAKLAQALKSM